MTDKFAPAPWTFNPTSGIVLDAQGRPIVFLAAYLNEPGKIETGYLLASAPEGVALAQEVVREYENLEDRAPTEPECQECNLGTGPHVRTCAYHQAKALLKKAAGAEGKS